MPSSVESGVSRRSPPGACSPPPEELQALGSCPEDKQD